MHEAVERIGDWMKR